MAGSHHFERNCEKGEVKNEIESRILAKKHDAFFQDWLKSMRSKYKIHINRELLNEMEIN